MSIPGSWSNHQQRQIRSCTSRNGSKRNMWAGWTTQQWENAEMCWAVDFLLCAGQVSGTRREISLFIGGDSVPFRPGHGRVHQSPRIDEDTAEQWPCCGPIKSQRLWHWCWQVAMRNTAVIHWFSTARAWQSGVFTLRQCFNIKLNLKMNTNSTYASLPLSRRDCIQNVICLLRGHLAH